ncbi:MAG: RNA polymerase sigma factor [Deltaproteobacteria bacterium]|nr:RNA polymerase sigma factor [Deltaproteobacteria bacterium]
MATLLSPDHEILPRLKAGDEGAFVELLDAWSPSLRRLARNFVKTEALAEEVVQETWMGVIKGISRFEGRSSLKTWVFTILANRARTRGTRESRSLPLSALGDPERSGAVDPDRFLANGAWGEPPFVWRAQSAESVVRARESLSVLEKALAALPDRQRRVVVLRDVEGVDAVDVCNVLEISESNQRVLLHRGRSKLRAALEKHYQGADDESERSRAVAH